MGNSPPLATRTGWIALAILPFSMYVILCSSCVHAFANGDSGSALATKVNYIGTITGFSHEKLQVFHRWCAWIMCTLAKLSSDDYTQLE